MRFAAAIFLAIGLVAAQVAHGGLLVPFLPFPAYALVGVGMLCAVVAGLRSDRKPWAVLTVFVIVLAAYSLWRCANAPDATLAMVDAALFLACFSMWAGTSLAVARNDARFVFLVIILAACCVQVVFAVLQLVKEAEFSMPYWFSEQLKSVYAARFPYRARGLFMNPNQFAWLMNAMALMALSLGIWGRLRAVPRIALLYLAAVFGVTTVLSASRGGMVSLVTGFGFFLILSLVAVFVARGARRMLLLGVGLVLLTICAGATYVAFSTSWMAQSRLDSLLNVEVRGAFAEEAVRLFQTQPLFGVGPGMYRYAARIYRTGPVVEDPIYAHDDWLQFLAEYGIIGLSILVIVLLTAFFAGGRSFLALVKVASGETGNATSNSAAFTLGAVCALVAATVHSNVDFNMHVPANALLAAAMLGFVTGVRPTEFEGQPSRLRPFVWVTATAGLAICVGLGMILSRHAGADYYALLADNDLTVADDGKALADAQQGLRLLPDDAGLLARQARAFYEYESWLQITASDVADQKKEAENSGKEKTSDSDDDADDDDDDGAAPETALLTPEESRKNFAGSEQSFARAARLQPMERELYLGWGKAEAALGHEKSALGKYQTAIRLDPVHAHAWAAYGDYLLELEKTQQARRVFEIGAHLPGGAYSQSQVESIDEDIAAEKESEGEPSP